MKIDKITGSVPNCIACKIAYDTWHYNPLCIATHFAHDNGSNSNNLQY